jgi:hypothetical protein
MEGIDNFSGSTSSNGEIYYPIEMSADSKIMCKNIMETVKLVRKVFGDIDLIVILLPGFYGSIKLLKNRIEREGGKLYGDSKEKNSDYFRVHFQKKPSVTEILIANKVISCV